jgi:hypothetical protein
MVRLIYRVKLVIKGDSRERSPLHLLIYAESVWAALAVRRSPAAPQLGLTAWCLLNQSLNQDTYMLGSGWTIQRSKVIHNKERKRNTQYFFDLFLLKRGAFACSSACLHRSYHLARVNT